MVADIEGGKEAEGVGNRGLKGIFGPKRDEVKRKWRKLRNKELNDLYCSPNIVVKS